MRAGGIEWTPDDKLEWSNTVRKWEGAYKGVEVHLRCRRNADARSGTLRYGPWRWRVNAHFPDAFDRKDRSVWVERSDFTTRREAIESLKVAVDFLRGMSVEWCAANHALMRSDVENIIRRWL